MKFDFLPGAARQVALGIALGGALAAMAMNSAAVEPAANAARVFAVRIQVSLFNLKPATRLNESSGVVVWLVPADPVPTTTDFESPHYRLVQHDKSFRPHILVIPAGGTVEFRNEDHWFHHAFSSFDSTRFDMGRQPPGMHKMVRFDRTGVVHVFCTMHPQMAAVIVTVDSPYFGVSDRAGHVTIGNVPAGTYSLRAWSDGVSPHALRALHRTIVLGDQLSRVPEVSIAITRQRPLVDESQKGGTVAQPGSSRSSTICGNSPAAPPPRCRPESSTPDRSRPSATPAAGLGLREENQFGNGR